MEWLQRAVLGAFLVAILAGIFLPIYGDEVGWRFQERAALDGVDKLFSDGCGANTLARPPFFMMPVRAYSAFFNTRFADPFFVRASGVLYAVLWAGLLLALIARIARGRPDRTALTMVGIGLMSLGMMPLLLVWSRPEQPIVLVTTAALLFGWIGSQDRAVATPARTAWLRSIVIVVLATIAYSYHLKALFLVPVFLACLVFASRGREAVLPRAITGLVFLGITAWAAAYWVHRMQCPDDAWLRAAYAGNNMGVYLAGARNLPELIAAVGRIIANADPFHYFELPVPRADPLSQWVEANQLSTHDSSLWNRALVTIWWGTLLFAVWCLIARIRVAWRERQLDARPVFAIALFVTVLGWSASQAHSNVYEAIFTLPLFMLAILFALSGNAPGQGLARWTGGLAAIVGGLGIASLVAVSAIYVPSLVRANRQLGYIEAQRFSQPVFGYSVVRRDIVGAARQCGIGDPAAARALMIDDVTYFAFMRSRLPQHYLGVVGLWRGKITDPVAYLRARGSSGAVLGCHLLPDDLRRRARRQGQFCCLGPPNW
jgi:hypothetical protein